jgi:hypothetical protein
MNRPAAAFLTGVVLGLFMATLHREILDAAECVGCIPDDPEWEDHL